MSELTHAISSAESDEFIRLLAQGQLIDDRAEAAAEAPHEEDEGDDECAICQEIVRTPVKSPNAGCTHTYCASLCWLSATPPPMTQQHRESEKMNTNLKAENADLKAEIARQRKLIARWEGWSKSQTITKVRSIRQIAKEEVRSIRQIAKEEDLFNPLGQAALCCAMMSSS